jgi:DNA-binding beta-propeller fold protein YncE/predicted Ser/Thr protein kinase
MHQPTPVQRIETGRNLGRDPKCFVERERTVAAQAIFERSAGHVGGDEVARPVGLAGVEHRDKVVVLDVSRGPRLVDEPRAKGLVCPEPLLQQLERDDITAGIRVCPVDNANGSFAQPSVDPVTPDSVPHAGLGASDHGPSIRLAIDKPQCLGSRMGVDARLDSLVAGYRVERLLGRGGMGAVYLADDVQLGRKVALKLLVPELSEDASFRERFLRESRIAAGMEHPNVVPIYQAGDADGTLFIAMRYVEGTDLKRLLADVGRLDSATIASVASQVAAALDAAHRRGLVHRDVKPGNVLLAADGHVYLSDFGLTKQTASQSGLTATGQLVGTLDYVAPEQIQGQPVDGRADVYSLACLLHECLTGTPPFRRETDVATLWAHIQDQPLTTGDTRVDAVLAKGLAKTPDARHSTAGELADDLRHAIDISSSQIPVHAGPPRRLDRRLIIAGAAVVVVVAAVAAVILIVGGSGARGLDVVPPHSLGLIEPKNGTIAAAIHVGPSPTRAVFGAGSIWVASTDDGTLQRIDSGTHQIVKTIGLGFRPSDIAVAPSGVYLGDPDSGSVVRVDAESNAVSEAIRVGEPGQARFAPSHLTLGAGSLWGNVGFGTTRAFRLKLDSNALRSIDLGAYSPDALAYTDGALWTLDSANGVISRLDPRRNAVTATIPLGSGAQAPYGTALTAGTTGVWAIGVQPQPGVATPDYSRAARAFHIDARLNGVVTSVEVGRQNSRGRGNALGSEPTPTGTAAVGEGAVWVANGGDGTLMKIDPKRNAVVKTIQVGQGVDGVAVGDGYVWVSRP